MITKNKIHEGTLELYDMLLNYFMDKGGYSKKVRRALNNLYKVVLEQVNEYSKSNSIKADIKEIKTYYVEKGFSGKINRVELDWDCYMLYNLVVIYFSNKYGAYPNNIEIKLAELERELLNMLPSNELYLEEKVKESYTEQQTEYVD